MQVERVDMAIKPTSVQAALLDEILQGVTASEKYEDFEKEELQDFREQLDRYATA